jgi:hypothetical protein
MGRLYVFQTYHDMALVVNAPFLSLNVPRNDKAKRFGRRSLTIKDEPDSPGVPIKGLTNHYSSSNYARNLSNREASRLKYIVHFFSVI